MKTFETEKHNIPEGATHYFDETSEEHFTWWDDNKQMLLDPENANEWVRPNEFDDVSNPVEIKKPRTKTEFVKVEFEKLSDAAIAVDTGEIYYTNYGEQAVGEYGLALHYYNMRSLKFYRKVETEIDERNEFIDTAVELLNQNSHDNEANHYKEWFGAMFDSGKFKLVD